MPTKKIGEENIAECILCMTNPANVIFTPCNHLCYCEVCYSRYKINCENGTVQSGFVCPTCRVPIEDKLTFFLAKSNK